MKKQKRYSEKEKADFVKAYQSSGLSQVKFCAQAGLSHATFKNWHFRAKQTSSLKKPDKYYRVQLPASNASHPSSTPMLRIQHPNGCQIEIGAAMPSKQLESVLTWLGVIPCSA